MKPSQLLWTWLFSQVVLALAEAELSEMEIERRQDTLWPKCSPTGPGFCTVYMATADVKGAVYRTAVLFSSDCTITDAKLVDKTDPKITLKGHLPYYVDLYVDTDIHPRGHITYRGDNTDLGESMACYKYPDTDGTSCRKAFDCWV